MHSPFRVEGVEQHPDTQIRVWKKMPNRSNGIQSGIRVSFKTLCDFIFASAVQADGSIISQIKETLDPVEPAAALGSVP